MQLIGAFIIFGIVMKKSGSCKNLVESVPKCVKVFIRASMSNIDFFFQIKNHKQINIILKEI